MAEQRADRPTEQPAERSAGQSAGQPTESWEPPPAEWNDTARPFEDQVSMIDLIERRVRESPEAPAVRLGEGEVRTYAQLWADSGLLARFLAGHGVGRGAFVGILHENSWDSVLAVVGVLRTGAAYVPLDARWPATRIAAPLRQSGIGWLVTGHALARRAEEAGQLAGSGVRLVCTDLRAAAPDPLDTETVGLLWDTVAEDEDLARASGFNQNPGDGISAAQIDTYVSHVRDLVLSAAPTVDRPRVVEVGCGAGLIAGALRDRVAGYTGVDVSAVALERAGREAGEGARFVRAAAADLGRVVAPASADVVLLASVAQFFPGFEYLRSVLRDAVGALAPGGAVVLADLADLAEPGEGPDSGHLRVPAEWFGHLSAQLGLPVRAEIHRRGGDGWPPVLRDRYDVVLRLAPHDTATPYTPVISAWSDVEEARALPLPAGPGADDTAYVIFTSGSTGVPKGVSVRHRSAVNVIQWVNQTYAVGPDDCLLWVTALTFDLSVYDLLGVLAAGASLRVVPAAELSDGERLLDIMLREPITFWDSAPAALGMVMSFADGPDGAYEASATDGTGTASATGSAAGGGPVPSLRLVFLSGDWVPLALPGRVRARFPRAHVVALGGATEATIWSNHFDVGEIDPAWTSVPYGKPIQNARYYVLDGDRKPCPIGVEGDLHIAGVVVADGYVGDPELTAAKFTADTVSGLADESMYATGDRARWMADGNLEFRGRRDDQVKVRGYRIELGEVLAALRQVPGVVDCAVTTLRGDDGPQIVAAVAVGGSEPSPGGGFVRRHLAQNLPSYMLPEHVLVLPALPVGPTGKVDRERLARLAARPRNRRRT
ncbi:AMP-binding protein [Streptomyces sp. NBC_00103]|uniref:AMP-binding protein n=2 Tax=unclassified Streptomyces TaxID=2593676 RepID=UPI002259645B|nr:AMP-binding protein [Streptomyces sp. NBC_00103]MCX5370149.1 AMP-binding protein [Streptomyces sp. NBC_00103]